MPIKYIPYDKQPVAGQAILGNAARPQRLLRYAGNDKVYEKIIRGMPYYETETTERVNGGGDNLLLRGECLSACAYLKAQEIKADLVYIDPPFASGANYAKKIYLRRRLEVAEGGAPGDAYADHGAQEIQGDSQGIEQEMYGDIWRKEDFLNYMYENLSAIKEIMSDSASIYVHLDSHIGHYVKILLDEVFGEENFVNEIIWHYPDNFQGNVKGFAANHHNIYWYSKSANYRYNKIMLALDKPKKRGKRVWSSEEQKLVSAKDENGHSVYDVFTDKKSDDVWTIGQTAPTNSTSKEYTGYPTQKPEALLRRIIQASSDEGMLVADFWGGSGVTAKAAHDLGRRFIHCDVGINSLQTARDRLIAAGAAFDVREIKDGVRLFRNPQQTMKKLPQLIDGLSRQLPQGMDARDWFGVIHDSRDGIVPVSMPNLNNSSERVLDESAVNEIIHDRLNRLQQGTEDLIKRIIVYYVDIEDGYSIRDFIQRETATRVELRDLKMLLDFIVCEDEIECRWDSGGLVKKLAVTRFRSDRMQQLIDDYNSKRDLTKNREPIAISDAGLELIECVSADCTNDSGAWTSDAEVKIDKTGCMIINGQKTKDYWDGAIECPSLPKRLRIRNIAGDETIIKPAPGKKP